ncbi:MAG: ACP S-malonyltransferase [Acidobacteria bacterium]|nr:ACP S-malonyltransferase [Acidobacteriota bacterium]
MIACVFPGQGSQAVGMGKPLVAASADAAEVFAQADAALGFALSSVIFEGPAEMLTLTEHTQPAILTMSTAVWSVLERRGLRPDYVAGHSLGEYSAHVAAGTLAFADAVRLVRNRGRYMQEAVPVGTGAMAAVLGLEEADVVAACLDAAQGEIVSPANLNGAGQIVIAGHTGAVVRAGDTCRGRGARRVIPLKVSAPFHCALMNPARDRLQPELERVPASEPRIPVIANVDAEPRTSATTAIDALVRQVAQPVRWEATVQWLAARGVETFVEVGPGAVLSGLIRKVVREARVLSVETPEDVEAAVAALNL